MGRLRQMLAMVALAVVLVVLCAEARWVVASGLPMEDFVQYWAAARLNLRGADPYNPAALLTVQRGLGWPEGEPNRMFNPPWMLALATPVAVLNYATARSACLVLQFAALAACALVIWDDRGGPLRLRPVAALLGLTAYPALISIRLGQSSVLVLAGLVGFLHWEGRRRDALAGAALALLAVKPHLLYLIWPAVGVWAVARRRWGVLVGAAAMLALLTAVAMAPNPGVFSQYFTMMRDRPPAGFASPTPGTLLRLALGHDRFWLQFVPPVAGLAWLAALRRSWLAGDRPWRDKIDPILFASLLTTPYGAWTPDMVVLQVPVLGVAAELARRGHRGAIVPALACWLTIDAAALVMGLVRTNEILFLWFTPATLATYVLARRLAGRLPDDITLAAPRASM